jgi:DNA polymerase III delta subunit
MMIYIFHGDNQFTSRAAFNVLLDKNSDSDILKIDSKETNLDNINNFINGQSLFQTKKIIAITNFFSIPKAILDKITKIIKSNPEFDVVIWQDKTLTATQLKTFPKATISVFALDKIMFSCINNIKPKNITNFIPLLHQVFEKEPFELFAFWLKFNLRKQLTSYSRFDSASLKKAYLQIIELDFQNKTGQLSIPKELALERILINLIK